MNPTKIIDMLNDASVSNEAVAAEWAFEIANASPEDHLLFMRTIVRACSRPQQAERLKQVNILLLQQHSFLAQIKTVKHLAPTHYEVKDLVRSEVCISLSRQHLSSDTYARLDRWAAAHTVPAKQDLLEFDQIVLLARPVTREWRVNAARSWWEKRALPEDLVRVGQWLFDNNINHAYMEWVAWQAPDLPAYDEAPYESPIYSANSGSVKVHT